MKLWSTLRTEELVTLENTCVFQIFLLPEKKVTAHRLHSGHLNQLCRVSTVANTTCILTPYLSVSSASSSDSGWWRSWEKELYTAQNCIKISIQACSESIWARQKCESMPDSNVNCVVLHREEQPRLPQVMSPWHTTAPRKNLTHFMLAVLCLRISVLNFTVQRKRAQSYQLSLVHPQRPSKHTRWTAAKYHHSS